MEQTVTQPQDEITITSIKVPTAVWLKFRGLVFERRRTVNEVLPEAIQMWLDSQTN